MVIGRIQMSKIYFDITDIIQFAGRSNRLTGIQRVQFNIINLLAHRLGAGKIACIFYDKAKRSFREFDPALRSYDTEFDAESLLIDLGLVQSSKVFPSKVQIKTYLRRHARSKLQRMAFKARIYFWALFMRQRLRDADLMPTGTDKGSDSVALRVVEQLPLDGHLAHLGSSWFFPEVWRFSAEHRARGGDVVQYVHDLIPITHPHFMPAKEPPQFENWLRHALDYATRFPCNSQWTASDLQRFSKELGRSSVTHVVTLAHEFVGYPRNTDVVVPERLASFTGKRFILCVGTIEARKNGAALLSVWRQLAAELGAQVPLLVFVGRYGKIGGDEFRDYLAASPELADLVVVVDGPSDQALAWLYRNCVFSTYPSHVEGWGLPVGEAAWFGRYCVASRASSIPEVCGDLIDYVDPDDLASIKAGILKPLLDPAYLHAKEVAIAAASLRTWQDVADELYNYIVNPQVP
jgi:glycosyltransferase involved in cell wall biosynthesis